MASPPYGGDPLYARELAGKAVSALVRTDAPLRERLNLAALELGPSLTVLPPDLRKEYAGLKDICGRDFEFDKLDSGQASDYASAILGLYLELWLLTRS